MGKQEKIWNLDSKELKVKIRLLNPKRQDSESLIFCIAWVMGEKILTKSLGWRVREGKVLSPCVRTAKGWIPTHTTTEEFLNEVNSLLEPWGKSNDYKGILFPPTDRVPTTPREMTEKDFRKPGVVDMGEGKDIELVSSVGTCCRCYWKNGNWIYTRDTVGCDCHVNPAELGARLVDSSEVEEASNNHED